MSSNELPDILVFMSDQHNARLTETASDPYISTPNLTRLAADGTEYANAYTSCPLCVPARSSMLTGQLPSKTGIFTNSGVINGDQATFAHSLGAVGYETVLCGRMHFLGPDQFHGFTRRLVGDFTPCFHGRYGKQRADLGPYVGTPAGDFDKLYGGGTSPVLEYDRAVVEAALEYLAQPHERPIFLLVGIYGPHHTFVAPPELYRKYMDLVGPPNSDAQAVLDIHPALQKKVRSFDSDVIHSLRAAYYGLVEHVDTQVGRVRSAWQEHLGRNKRPGVFCYLSDHGEHAGEKGLWGKMSFHEESARIPLIFAGSGIQSGVRSDSACSIMDLGPTLCELANAPLPPEQDGASLVPFLKGMRSADKRIVISELLENGIPARMIRFGDWKYIAYAETEKKNQLFNLISDPYEYRNCIHEHPDVAAELKAELDRGWSPETIIADHHHRQAHWKILSEWGRTVDVPEPHRWLVPESSWELPAP